MSNDGKITQSLPIFFLRTRLTVLHPSVDLICVEKTMNEMVKSSYKKLEILINCLVKNLDHFFQYVFSQYIVKSIDSCKVVNYYCVKASFNSAN